MLTEDEADAAFYDYEMDLIDDIGIEGFTPSFQKRILSEFVKDGWFESAFREMYENYAYDISDEYDFDFGDRLVSECYDAGVIDDDDFDVNEDGDTDYTSCALTESDLVERLVDYLVDSIDDYAEEFRFQLGDEAFDDAVKRYNLVDWDAVIEETKELDGRGSMLAGYDGKELEWDDYYIYRTN